ncbi:hypothetical protein PVAND_013701 [Polypedilum vanderplanki]|uniref:Alpha-2-macroglobulin domain-containing protein n=1 Tax=Polypedilum vanderplanki TaxID=319348 RepID=A0A9J6CSD3_POLVA|nr:hypothetical protein PVAND_013701 [Polypedilum vanderplanki]
MEWDCPRIFQLQPFIFHSFLSLELPYSVKRNEIITLDIQQFNYLTSSQTVNLTVVNNPSFEVVNAKSNGWTVAKLSIKPKVIGPIVLKISAKSSSAGDAIEKVLNVIPEGVQRSITTSTLIAVD